MTYNGPWFPLEPLLARYDGCADLARHLGVNRRSVYVKRDKGLPLRTAEEWCDKLRVNPSEVWPGWAAAITPDLPALRACACDGCPETFPVPRRAPLKRYCSEQCNARDRMRRYRATERGKQANRDYVREYKAFVRARRGRAA